MSERDAFTLPASGRPAVKAGDLIAFDRFSYQNVWGGTGLSWETVKGARPTFRPLKEAGAALGIVESVRSDSEIGATFVVRPADRACAEHLLDCASGIEPRARVSEFDAKAPTPEQAEVARSFLSGPEPEKPRYPAARAARAAARPAEPGEPEEAFGISNGAVVRLGKTLYGIVSAVHNPEVRHSIYMGSPLSERTGKMISGRLCSGFDSCSLRASGFEILGYADEFQAKLAREAEAARSAARAAGPAR